jgi:hypothetical protein
MALSQKLGLSDNQLTGQIPESIGNLPKLTWLNLRDNQLNGSIPDTIGDLSFLTSLSLYGNQLSGQIPASIGNLTNLYCYVYPKNDDLCRVDENFTKCGTGIPGILSLSNYFY